MKIILKNLSIKWQLIFISFTIIFIPIFFLGIFFSTSIRKDMLLKMESNLHAQMISAYNQIEHVNNVANENLKLALATTRMAIITGVNTTRKTVVNESQKNSLIIQNQSTQETEPIDLPSLCIENEAVRDNTRYVDQIKSLINCEVTIFQLIPQGMLRISTTVLRKDGQRAVNTYIPSDSPVYKAIKNGDTYLGRAFVVSEWYITGYEPIKDINGKIIGALFVGYPQKKYSEGILDQFSKTVIGETGCIWILNSKGEYILSEKMMEDGGCVMDVRDASGKYFFKDIIEKAKKLPKGETELTEYSWKAKGATFANEKIASYAYYPEWDWIIGLGSYKTEFLKELEKLKVTGLVIAFISILFGAFLSYIFSNIISKNLNTLVSFTESVGNGDLTVSLNESEADSFEVKRIVSGMQVMENNLKSILQDIFNATSILLKSSTGLSTSSSGIAEAAQKMTTEAQNVTSTTEKMALNINTMAVSAEEMSVSASSVASAATQMSQNMNSVSATVEEISNSISNIVQNARDAGSISDKAVNMSGEATITMNNLGDSAKKISKVTDVIKRIAEQTNLLALNATIEAASAGEAGKGFSVVANEIKTLANQSAQAAGDIASMIEGIQINSGKAVTVISDISGIINKIEKSIEVIIYSVEAVGKAIFFIIFPFFLRIIFL